jgi:hypothetical protein
MVLANTDSLCTTVSADHRRLRFFAGTRPATPVPGTRAAWLNCGPHELLILLPHLYSTSKHTLYIWYTSLVLCALVPADRLDPDAGWYSRSMLAMVTSTAADAGSRLTVHSWHLLARRGTCPNLPLCLPSDPMIVNLPSWFIIHRNLLE